MLDFLLALHEQTSAFFRKIKLSAISLNMHFVNDEYLINFLA
jgi:hypothetical protein